MILQRSGTLANGISATCPASHQMRNGRPVNQVAFRAENMGPDLPAPMSWWSQAILYWRMADSPGTYRLQPMEVLLRLMRGLEHVTKGAYGGGDGLISKLPVALRSDSLPIQPT